MKKAFLVIAIATLVSGNALAFGDNFGGDGGSANAGAAAGAIAGAAAGANAQAGVRNNVRAFGGNAHQGQLQGQVQGQLSKQANSQKMQYNEAKQDYSNMYEDYAAPGYAPSINATVPCAIPVTGGLTLPGVGGLSGGSAYVDEECEVREAVRLGLSSNDAATQDLANQLLRAKLTGMMPASEPGAPSTADIQRGNSVAGTGIHSPSSTWYLDL